MYEEHFLFLDLYVLSILIGKMGVGSGGGEGSSFVINKESRKSKKQQKKTSMGGDFSFEKLISLYFTVLKFF